MSHSGSRSAGSANAGETGTSAVVPAEMPALRPERILAARGASAAFVAQLVGARLSRSRLATARSRAPSINAAYIAGRVATETPQVHIDITV